MIDLYDYQEKALKRLRTGSILCGGVGSGKSVVALAYYIFVCGGDYKKPRDLPFYRKLYIITTAKKRNSFEWDKECDKFSIVDKTIDSWNNIKKYKDVFGAFFIFDEQRVVGSGSWVKTFLNISRKNKWILLSATPGDQWTDYIPVFIANGFYKNKTDFTRHHCIYSRFSKYPKIERFIEEQHLGMLRDKILVPMQDFRTTHRNKIHVPVSYDRNLYRIIVKDRWNPYENCPIEESAKLFYLMRQVVNSDPSRLTECIKIIEEKKKVIIFYNFNYELEMLRTLKTRFCYDFAEWNGHTHEEVPNSDNWIYLVQYTAGSEGWNCISTNTIIFFSQSYSYRQTEQAMGRIDRINTPYKELYYYFLKSNSPIDLAIFRALSAKKNFNERKFRFI